MPRRPTTATVQLSKIRMKEGLRRQLESEAKRNGVSLSGEIVGRLEQTFEQVRLLDINQITENVQRNLSPLIEGAHDLNLQGDLMRAAQALISRVEPLLAARIIGGAEAEGMRRAIEQVYLAMKAIDQESAQRVRRMRTTGAAL